MEKIIKNKVMIDGYYCAIFKFNKELKREDFEKLLKKYPELNKYHCLINYRLNWQGFFNYDVYFNTKDLKAQSIFNRYEPMLLNNMAYFTLTYPLFKSKKLI